MTRTLNEYYVKPIAGVIQNPGIFFNSLKKENWKSLLHALGIVVISSAISAFAGTIINPKINFVMVYFILFANALGMTLISTGMGFCVAKIVAGPSIKGIPFFNIYALSFGVTLLFSWIPYSQWITEPWKWWIVGTGLINGAGVEFKQAIMIILFSIGAIVATFWALLKIT